ncbi:hypothetical protein QAD02_008936 [Eretmocerus hayati]|uniref:Uncharacterized protein n=1 Tax=Eretmocerus hayati TaxID=131215 RepID=A0ACC2N891_9HYME|nr:hypothetical protein QAD02_008936 [Eretmocerus hayati]
MIRIIVSALSIACFTAIIQGLSISKQHIQIDVERVDLGAGDLMLESFPFAEEMHLQEWATFKAKYEKNYSEEEEPLRLKNFLENREKISRHNARYELGEVTFQLEINKFGDMSVKEFSERMNGFNKPARMGYATAIDSAASSRDSIDFLVPEHVHLPKDVDWRKNGAVTPIKDQGQCGSCWAFSATGSLEGQHFRHNGTLISLSEQNLVDCSGKNGNQGCDGGLMNNAFMYVKNNRGIDTEKSYAYEARDDICRYKPQNSGADDAGFVNIMPRGNETSLQVAVATVGPISVAIDADHDSFMFYKSGVYFEHLCSSKFLDHGVLAIGYGTDESTGKDFWLVKNSWGEDWGEKGYIRMARNKRNMCGIATSASYPLVK